MKQFYAGGFLYNPRSKKVLLHKRDDATKNNPNSWAFFGGLGKRGETPEESLQREIYEELKLRVPIRIIHSLYDYFNEDYNTHRYVFYISPISLKSKLKLTEGEDYAWIGLSDAFKKNLSKRTRQDLIFFSREMSARVRSKE